MFKKSIAVIFSVVLVFGLCACGGGGDAQGSSEKGGYSNFDAKLDVILCQDLVQVKMRKQS